MSDFVRFLIAGVSLGSIYALISRLIRMKRAWRLVEIARCKGLVLIAPAGLTMRAPMLI
jgi:uncharacterized membrane protein (UPF0136 family)